jgi:hypothetical protein
MSIPIELAREPVSTQQRRTGMPFVQSLVAGMFHAFDNTRRLENSL